MTRFLRIFKDFRIYLEKKRILLLPISLKICFSAHPLWKSLCPDRRMRHRRKIERRGDTSNPAFSHTDAQSVVSRFAAEVTISRLTRASGSSGAGERTQFPGARRLSAWRAIRVHPRVADYYVNARIGFNYVWKCASD